MPSNVQLVRDWPRAPSHWAEIPEASFLRRLRQGRAVSAGFSHRTGWRRCRSQPIFRDRFTVAAAFGTATSGRARDCRDVSRPNRICPVCDHRCVEGGANRAGGSCAVPPLCREAEALEGRGPRGPSGAAQMRSSAGELRDHREAGMSADAAREETKGSSQTCGGRTRRAQSPWASTITRESRRR